MRRCFALLFAVAALAMSGGASSATGLPRVVSMNVCSDQLLLTLADAEQILGLSRCARDGWQSWAADKARRFPVLSGGAPLSEFVKRSYTTPLLFAPGTEFRYQSMGILLAAEIVQRITHRPLPEFLRDHVWDQFRMRDLLQKWVLGLPALHLTRSEK